MRKLSYDFGEDTSDGIKSEPVELSVDKTEPDANLNPTVHDLDHSAQAPETEKHVTNPVKLEGLPVSLQ